MSSVEDVKGTIGLPPDAGLSAHVGVIHLRSILGLRPAWQALAAEQNHVHVGRNIDVVPKDVRLMVHVARFPRAVAKNEMPSQGDPMGTLVLKKNEFLFRERVSLYADDSDHPVTALRSTTNILRDRSLKMVAERGFMK